MNRLAACLLLIACAKSLIAQPAFQRKDFPVDRPGPAVVADFNGDLRPDILVRSDTSLSVLLNSGDGLFTPVSRTTALPRQVHSMVVADFTGDGRLDVVEGTGLFFGLPDGTFLPLRSISEVQLTHTQGIHVATGGFDGDRKADLILGDDDRTFVLLGNGNGTFRLSALMPGRLRPFVADLNADGLSDLAICCPASILLSRGDGTFERHVQNPKIGWWSLIAADFNRDGLPDIATSWGVHLGNGDGSFQDLLPYATDPQTKGVDPYPSDATDLDGDGYVDLVLSYGGDAGEVNFVSVLRGAGDGTMSPSVEYTVGQQAGAAGGGDLDGDGRPDVLTVNFRSNTVSVLLNRSDPPLHRAVALAIESTRYCIGSPWHLTVSHALPGSTIRLSGTSNGAPWTVDNWHATDLTGRLEEQGTFTPKDEGRHTVKVEIAGKNSNAVSFVVINCDS